MSAKVVRDAARAMVQDGGWPAALPFFETVNKQAARGATNDLASWSTLEFDLTADREPIDIGGSCFLERGQISVVIAARSGSGDSAPMDAWPAVDAFVRGWSWPAGLSVSAPSPPDELTDEPDGRWQRWEVAVPYIYQDSD